MVVTPVTCIHANALLQFLFDRHFHHDKRAILQHIRLGSSKNAFPQLGNSSSVGAPHYSTCYRHLICFKIDTSLFAKIEDEILRCGIGKIFKGACPTFPNCLQINWVMMFVIFPFALFSF
jgi:hypothetical protein